MSEKKTKLSLNEPDPSGFRAFVLSDSATEEAPNRESFPAATRNQFGLPKSFWEWLGADAELKLEFEKMIEARVKERIEERFQELKAEVQSEGKSEGKRQGIEESKKTVDQSLAHLEKICATVIQEKARLLRDHETIWIKTFSHLLRRFLVPGHQLAVDHIDTWLTDSLGAFDTQGKIKIHLSPNDFRMISESVSINSAGRWRFVEDFEVKDGQIHCECDDGGVLFSTETEMEKLDLWVNRFVSRTDKEPT